MIAPSCKQDLDDDGDVDDAEVGWLMTPRVDEAACRLLLELQNNRPRLTDLSLS